MDKVYRIEYKKSKARYTRGQLVAVARDCGLYDMEDDHDFLVCAMRHYCRTHFMAWGGARLDCYDADTRGCLWQEWLYQPDGAFRGRIHAIVE